MHAYAYLRQKQHATSLRGVQVLNLSNLEVFQVLLLSAHITPFPASPAGSNQRCFS